MQELNFKRHLLTKCFLGSVRGSVLLEFSICISLLFMLAFSAIGLSFALRERIALAEAARIGARSASMLPAGTSPEAINETALFAAAKYLDRSGYPSAHYKYKIAPSQLTVANSGSINYLKLQISRHESGIPELIGNLAGNPALVAEFPLSGSNSASSFDSEVAFHND